jgi:hypothetical protein
VVLLLFCKWYWNLTHVLVSDNPKQISDIPVFIRILDINDHAPEFATYYETYVCENAKPGQVNKIIIKFQHCSLYRGRWRYFICIIFSCCYYILFYLLICFYQRTHTDLSRKIFKNNLAYNIGHNRENYKKSEFIYKA